MPQKPGRAPSAPKVRAAATFPGARAVAEEQSQGAGTGTGSAGDTTVGCFVCDTDALYVKIKNNNFLKVQQ